MARVFKELFPKPLTSDPNSAPKFLDNVSGGVTLVLGGIFDGVFKAQSAYDERDSGDVLIDGDMELPDTSAWTLSYGAMSKETGDPHGGSRVLRLTDAGAGVGVAQNILISGRTYNVQGYARSDGIKSPIVSLDGGITPHWTGTTSTAWQPFDFTIAASGTYIVLLSAAALAGYIEFDDISVHDIDGAGKWADISGTAATGIRPSRVEVVKAVTDRFRALRLVTTTNITNNSTTVPARCMVVYDEV